MIRINLLPGEERKNRRASVPFKTGDLVLPIGILAAAMLFMGGVLLSQRSTASRLERNIADVEQKLQPIGQPTEGMTVAAVTPRGCGRRRPIIRTWNPETMAGCRMGAESSSPR